MHNILITTSSFAEDNPVLLDILSYQDNHIILNPYRRKLNDTEVTALIEQYQPVGIIAGIEPLTRNVLEKSKNLKVISRCGIGLDTIDMDAAKKLDIIVTNTPDAPTVSVAELTLGMILSVLRHIHISDVNIRRGEWVRPMGNLLQGKTVGVIGCGRIGSYLIKLLSVFGCNILGYDLMGAKNECINCTDLDVLLSRSDIISLHIPFNKENYHFINKRRLFSIKKGAVLINAARGGLIDEECLYDAIVSDHLSGAALDCFESEPYKGKLKELDNVLLTSHIGSYAKESRRMMEKQSVENLLRELKKVGYLSKAIFD